MFMFDAPWFALLLPVPLLVLFLAPEAKKNLPVLFYPHLARLKASFKETTLAKSRFFSWQTMLFYVLWISLVGALMGPQLVDKYSHTKSYGYDLMLAVDISQSMEALDFSTKVSRVSRLDATKEVVSDFVKGRQGDRVGLVLFGEFAHLQIPLTQDTLSVGKMLENAESGMAGGATAIGDAIGLAVKNLRERPEGSRILILLTDGENNAGSIPPIEAAKLAKEYGIRIYTIGMGSTGAVPFPNRYGQIVMANVSLDEPLLKEISISEPPIHPCSEMFTRRSTPSPNPRPRQRNT